MPPLARRGWCCRAPYRQACRRLVRRDRRDTRTRRVQGRRRHLRAPTRRPRRIIRPRRPRRHQPNAEELAGLVGCVAEMLESAASSGDPEPVVLAAQRLIELGARTVWSLSARRARCSSTRQGLDGHAPADHAAQHGRCGGQLAGWLPARRSRRAEPPQRLQMAVAYAARRPRCPGRRCHHHRRSTSKPFGCMRLHPNHSAVTHQK